jgi:ABC-type polysaccharide/polyol phosphate export permease
MLLYTFVFSVVFESKVENFSLIIFLGLTIWNYFNKVVIASAAIVRKNKGTVAKVYIPKFIFILINMGVAFVKMSVCFGIVIIMMVVVKIQLTTFVFFVIPYLLLLVLLTFGISTILLHIGVFVEDISNVLTIGLRMLFYLSGIFFLISGRFPYPYDQILLKVNPLALLIESIRDSLVLGVEPHWGAMLVWFAIALGLSFLGIHLIYKYENTYVKVIK